MADLEGMTRSARPEPNAKATQGLARSLVQLTLAVWFVIMLGVGASLLARHEVALPRPTIEPAFVTAMGTLRTPDDAGQWMVVHVLYAECRCSTRMAEHLIALPRLPGVTEEVIFVGHAPDLEARLSARAYRVISVTPAELEQRFHIVAAPSFVVTAPDGSVRYAGGYTTRKQAPDPRDRDILAALRMGRQVEPLPVLGCAVSEKLQADLNPLRIP
jgi:hypothetical protein